MTEHLVESFGGLSLVLLLQQQHPHLHRVQHISLQFLPEKRLLRLLRVYDLMRLDVWNMVRSYVIFSP